MWKVSLCWVNPEKSTSFLKVMAYFILLIGATYGIENQTCTKVFLSSLNICGWVASDRFSSAVVVVKWWASFVLTALLHYCTPAISSRHKPRVFLIQHSTETLFLWFCQLAVIMTVQIYSVRLHAQLSRITAIVRLCCSIRQLQLSEYTCQWENWITGWSMSYPGTIGGAVPISTSGNRATSSWPLLAVILEESRRRPSTSGSRPRKKSRACAERKIRSDLMERIHATINRII